MRRGERGKRIGLIKPSFSPCPSPFGEEEVPTAVTKRRREGCILLATYCESIP